MSEITIQTADGARLAFPCANGDYVLTAAEAAGFYLPAMCRDGVCGACHAHVSNGHYNHGPIAPHALPDARSGGTLLCRCRPEGDLLITVPYPGADIRRQAIVAREASIVELTRVGASGMALKVTLTPNAELGIAADFQPGQYMEVGIRDVPLRRAYSMANLPNFDGQFEFLIRLKPGGVFSTWLDKYARIGDKLLLRGPFGRFVLDDTSTRKRCFISGAFGFAPVLSMLRHLASFQDTQTTTLIFGTNQQDEKFGTGDIAELKTALPALRVIVSAWSPQARSNGFDSTVEAFANALGQDGAQTDVYACGPQNLLEPVRSVASAHHIPPNQIFTEQIL
jgi:ferredoxin-NADP reductase/ferredoxin